MEKVTCVSDVLFLCAILRTFFYFTVIMITVPEKTTRLLDKKKCQMKKVNFPLAMSHGFPSACLTLSRSNVQDSIALRLTQRLDVSEADGSFWASLSNYYILTDCEKGKIDWLLFLNLHLYQVLLCSAWA